MRMVETRVIVTGARGQLGTDMASLLSEAGYEVHAFGREKLDFTNRGEVLEVVEALRPDIIVHCGAYTKVDQAETERELAEQVNGRGSGYLAEAAELVGAKLVYVSTDYVFVGTADEPIPESAATNPINVYGASKLLGETLVKAATKRYFIVRTSWVYGLHGSNFVKTMLTLGRQGKPLTVVEDQFGSPTFTVDLAESIWRLIQTDRYGTYHVSNSGSCSWYEFAQVIFEEAGLKVELAPVDSSRFVRPAQRPAYSVLRHQSLSENGFPAMRNWREGLKEFLALESKEVNDENGTAVGRIG